MNLLESVHQRYIVPRRIEVLCRHIASLIDDGASVLDVGCGDGRLAWRLGQLRPDLTICGIDVLARPQSWIPVDSFDGHSIPAADASVDAVLLVDVLHHTEDPRSLLAEAARVSHGAVIVKDHLLEGMLAGRTLRFMDRTHNARHGVALPFNYLRRRQWQRAFAELGLSPESWSERLNLYGPVGGLLFDRRMHFLSRLRPAHVTHEPPGVEVAHGY
jgi:SAM-dependent methyltransferase